MIDKNKVSSDYINIKTYLDLIKAKHNGTMKEELHKLISPDQTRVDAEYILAIKWLRSLHENSKLAYECPDHGTSHITPTIHKNMIGNLTYMMGNNLQLILKQPPFLVLTTGETVLKSIQSIVTENETIRFDELTESEINNLCEQITIEDINGILSEINKEFIYMVYTDCCDKTSTVHGFDKIMGII